VLVSARISRAGWLALAVLLAVQLLLIVDVVVVNVALPAIAADLRLTSAELPFTGIAYTLLFGSLLIVGGRTGDAYGRRRVLRAGLVLFLAGSLLAATAAAPAQLFVARAVQGLARRWSRPTPSACCSQPSRRGQRATARSGCGPPSAPAGPSWASCSAAFSPILPAGRGSS
jgi:MFS family permease